MHRSMTNNLLQRQSSPLPRSPLPQPAEPVGERERPKPEAPSPQSAPNQVEHKLRTMTHHYTSSHPRLHQNGTMPGTGFKIFAYTAIALLLALLVYIIIAGVSIESAV